MPIQVFTESGTWNFPIPGITDPVKVWVWAGGGGGGGTDVTEATEFEGGGAGGGGGGAFAYAEINGITGSQTVTVGEGGLGGEPDANGGDGEPSWFGSAATVFAEQGFGGEWLGTEGVGGSSASSIGDTTRSGGDGAGGVGPDGGGGGGAAGTDADGDPATGTTGGAGGTGTPLIGAGTGAGGDGGNAQAEGTIPGGGGGGANGPGLSSGANGRRGEVWVQWTAQDDMIYPENMNPPGCVFNQKRTKHRVATYGSSH